MNEIRHDWVEFPEDAYIGVPKRPHRIIGYVQASADFTALDPMNGEQKLCRNYYNKAVAKLLKYARDKKGDAVIQVRSVVLLVDGRVEEHETPECADEGGDAQILVKGTAIRWLTDEEIRQERDQKGRTSGGAPPATP